MPRKDGTGPRGDGAMSGRGLGLCTSTNAVKRGVGLGVGLGLGLSCRRGFGRGFEVNNASSRTQKQLLQEQKNILQNRLEAIDKQMRDL